MYLPVMDHKNKSIELMNISSFAVNTAIQRSLTKACARHGLGLYVYAGEDLPEADKEAEEKAKTTRIDEKTVAILEEMAKNGNLKKENVLKTYGLKDLSELTEYLYADLMRRLGK